MIGQNDPAPGTGPADTAETERYTRARCVVRQARRARTPANVAYVIYAALIALALYAPGLWGAIRHLARTVSAGTAFPGATLAGTAFPMAAVPAGIAAAVAATVMTALVTSAVVPPLWFTREERTFFLSGAFSPRRVLRGRACALVVAVAAVFTFVGSAGIPDITPATFAYLVLLAITTAMCAVTVAVAHQSYAGPATPRIVGVAVVLLAVLATRSVVLFAVLPLLLLLVAGWLGPRSVDAMSLDRVEAMQQRVRGAGAGWLTGDQAVAAGAFHCRSFRNRDRTIARWVARRSPVLARDILGAVRRPVAATVAIAVQVGAALWAFSALQSPSAAAFAVLMVASYAATGVWTSGLRQHACGVGHVNLFPGGPRRVSMQHTYISLLVVAGILVASVVGFAVGAYTGYMPCPTPARTTWGVGQQCAASAAMVVLPMVIRWWSSLGTQLPLALLTPIASPLGDLSVVLVAGWYLRGWVAAAVAAIILKGAWAASIVGFCLCAAAFAAVMAVVFVVRADLS